MNLPALLVPAKPLPARRTVARIMGLVLLALLPVLLAQGYFFGPDRIFQMLLAAVIALGIEALLLKMRGRALKPFLCDLSAPLTAVLFVLCLPPSLPWPITAIGIVAAIVLGKHLYGGLGHNLFNPAMLGIALVQLGFPDAFSHASLNMAGTDQAWLWLVVFYTLGGLFLLWKRIIVWQTPAAMLGSFVAVGLLLMAKDADLHFMSFEHFLPAVVVLTAFFIVTDPVTGCITARGRLIFGTGAGVLTALLIGFGRQPASAAFAVLMMNCAAPWIDQQMQCKHWPIGSGP